MKEDSKTLERVHNMIFAGVYPMYILKAEKKGRTKKEVDEIICWLTGFSKKELASEIKNKTNFKNFFTKAPKMNPL
jgi:hypothetical protein